MFTLKFRPLKCSPSEGWGVGESSAGPHFWGSQRLWDHDGSKMVVIAFFAKVNRIMTLNKLLNKTVTE